MSYRLLPDKIAIEPQSFGPHSSKIEDCFPELPNVWYWIFIFVKKMLFLSPYLNHSWEFAAINLAVHVNVRGNITPLNKYWGKTNIGATWHFSINIGAKITPLNKHCGNIEQNLTYIASWSDNLHIDLPPISFKFIHHY